MVGGAHSCPHIHMQLVGQPKWPCVREGKVVFGETAASTEMGGYRHERGAPEKIHNSGDALMLVAGTRPNQEIFGAWFEML